MPILVNFIYLLLIIAISPFFLYRVLRHKRYRTGWHQRLGNIKRRYPEKKCIWLHAVSLGEINAAKTAISQLEANYPDYEIAISSTTDTGFARACELYGSKHTVFYFPLDLSFTMWRAFNQIRPSICLLMELEVWYNFSRIANHMNIPVVVINGRLSTKSFSRYKIIRPLIKPMFGDLKMVLVQTEEYAKRFKFLGCPENRVLVTGSLKYDTAQVSNTVEGADELASLINKNSWLWVAGGTGPGEEEIIIEVYRRLKQNKQLESLKLAIIPRKPERFDEVAQLILTSGFGLIRYSQIKQTHEYARGFLGNCFG